MQHLDFGTEPTTAHSSGKRKQVSQFLKPLPASSALPQEEVPDWAESWHVFSWLPSFANHGASHTSSMQGTKTKVKKTHSLVIFLFCDLPGVNNIYTTSLFCAYANFWWHI